MLSLYSTLPRPSPCSSLFLSNAHNLTLLLTRSTELLEHYEHVFSGTTGDDIRSLLIRIQDPCHGSAPDGGNLKRLATCELGRPGFDLRFG